MSTGALAGIISGVVVGAIALALAIAGFIWARRKRAMPAEMADSQLPGVSEAKKEGGGGPPQLFEMDGQWYGSEMSGGPAPRQEMEASPGMTELDTPRQVYSPMKTETIYVEAR